MAVSADRAADRARATATCDTNTHSTLNVRRPIRGNHQRPRAMSVSGPKPPRWPLVHIPGVGCGP